MRFVFGYFFFSSSSLWPLLSASLLLLCMCIYVAHSFAQLSAVSAGHSRIHFVWNFSIVFGVKVNRVSGCQRSAQSVWLCGAHSSQITYRFLLMFQSYLKQSHSKSREHTHTNSSINKRLVGLVLAGDAVTFVYSGAAMRQRSPYTFRAATSHTYTHAIDMSATPAQAIPFNHFKLLQIPINFLAIYDTRSIHRTFMCLL